MNGIWASKSTSNGKVIVSMQLDGVLKPFEVLARLEKEFETLNSKLNQALAALEQFSPKTPATIVDATVNKVVSIHRAMNHNSKEWWRWEKAAYWWTDGEPGPWGNEGLTQKTVQK